MIISDVDYYYMIENEVRAQMPFYETQQVLPRIKQLQEDSGIEDNELEDFPVEGYYYKSLDLKEYFKVVRNFQDNEKLNNRVNRNSDNFKWLYNYFDNEIWGNEGCERYQKGVFKRKRDVLTNCIESEWGTSLDSRVLSINGIMEKIPNYTTNNLNLVNLAAKTKDERPVCCGAETNALYRATAMITGCYISSVDDPWQVTPELEEFGGEVVDFYNKNFGLEIRKPSKDGDNYFLSKIPEVPRVAKLAKILNTNEYYYWIMDQDTKNVTDLYSSKLITTEDLFLDKSLIEKNGYSKSSA